MLDNILNVSEEYYVYDKSIILFQINERLNYKFLEKKNNNKHSYDTLQ